MEIKVIEKKKDKLKLEVDGETHTLLNLLRERAWKHGAKQASYIIAHPYMSKPEIIIHATYPKKVLTDSANEIAKDAKKFELAFKKVK